MKVIKNNLGIFIALVIILLFIIGSLIIIKSFYPSGNEYGDRLKGIEKVSFSKKEITELEDKISDLDRIKKVTVDIKGRLINILITVEEETNLDDIKDYSKEKLELFDEDELKYYDIQFLVKNEKDDVEHYPAIGYKHKSNDDISWSNN
jgi:hypothetical protein